MNLSSIINFMWYLLWIVTYIITLILFIRNKNAYCSAKTENKSVTLISNDKTVNINRKEVCKLHNNYKKDLKNESKKSEWGDLLFSNKIIGFIVSIITFFVYKKQNTDNRYWQMLLYLYFFSSIVSISLITYIHFSDSISNWIVDFDNVMGYVTLFLSVVIMSFGMRKVIYKCMGKINKNNNTTSTKITNNSINAKPINNSTNKKQN